MAPFSNMRRHRRFSVDVRDIRGSAVFTSEVVIHDISVTGVSLITDRKLEVGREYSLAILDDSQDQPINATVIWCMENADGTEDEYGHLKYSAGLQFTNLQQGTILRLLAFIESHLIESQKQVKVPETIGMRCKIRFPVNAREATVLNVAEIYRVKELSLGGLLIESVNSFESDTRIHMGITMPGDMHLSFLGRIAYCMVSPDNASLFEVGIEFVEMPESDRARLKEFIRRLYLEDAGFPVNGILPNSRK